MYILALSEDGVKLEFANSDIIAILDNIIVLEYERDPTEGHISRTKAAHLAVYHYHECIKQSVGGKRSGLKTATTK